MQELTSLRHALYVNMRAVVLGSAIGYGFWYVAHHADQFSIVVLLMALLILVGTLWTIHFSFEKKYRLNYVLVPALLYASSLFFFLLLKNQLYQVLFSIGIAAIYIFLFRAYAELRQQPTPERKKSVTQALDIVVVMTMFVSFATLHELYFFFDWRLYGLLISGVVLTMLLLYATYWHNRIMTLRAWFFVVLGGLLMGEYLWALSFLPSGYLTTATLAVLGLFLYQAITVSALKGMLRRRVVLQHLAAASVISVVALLSSRWTPLV